MYKIRYIKASDITGVRYVFEEKEVEASDDSDAIAKFDVACAAPLEGSLAMDVVSGEAYDWTILKSKDISL